MTAAALPPRAELAELIGQALADARAGRRLLVVALPAPRRPPEALWRLEPGEPAVLWDPPAGPRLAGLGATCRLAPEGPEPLALVDVARTRLGPRLLRVAHPAAAAPPACLLGGAAFGDPARRGSWQGWPAATFTLPRWTYGRDADGCWLQLAVDGGAADAAADWTGATLRLLDRLARAEGGSVRRRPAAARVEQLPAERWRSMVEAAQREMAAGRLDKVVLARETTVRSDGACDPLDVIARLEAHAGASYRFAIRHGRQVFVGASPELLVAREGERVRAEALAGTATFDEDDETSLRRAAGWLAGSTKDGSEQSLVVEHLAATLGPLCRRLEVPERPEIRRLRGMLHLSTPVEGVLAAPTGAATLAARLHPTPAVGGTPRPEALAFIREHEPMNRGWYAGAFGRLDLDGDGELTVAIRSALLEPPVARVFAGAGIVAASDPDAEYAETAAKQRGLLEALGLPP
jgi:isochorismate synthase